MSGSNKHGSRRGAVEEERGVVPLGFGRKNELDRAHLKPLEDTLVLVRPRGDVSQVGVGRHPLEPYVTPQTARKAREGVRGVGHVGLLGIAV